MVVPVEGELVLLPVLEPVEVPDPECAPLRMDWPAVNSAWLMLPFLSVSSCWNLEDQSVALVEVEPWPDCVAVEPEPALLPLLLVPLLLVPLSLLPPPEDCAWSVAREAHRKREPRVEWRSVFITKKLRRSGSMACHPWV